MDKQLEKEYEAFLEKHPMGHFLQSTEWAMAKSGWCHELITARNASGQLKGTMSLLIRRIPLLGSIIYCPRGPICSPEDGVTYSELLSKMKKTVKKYRAFQFRMDPDIPLSDGAFQVFMNQYGLKPLKNNSYDITDQLQPSCVFRLPLRNRAPEEVFSSFSSKTRYNIRLASRKGVVVREGGTKDLPAFHEIMKTTGERDGFFIRSFAYFENLYQSFSDKHKKLYFAEYNGKPISAVLIIFYARKAWYLYGGSLNEYRNVMPNYLLQWTSIQEALRRGCVYYDFRGLLGCKGEKDSPGYGLYRFKKGFNPQLVEFTGEWGMSLKPFTNWLYHKLFRLYKATVLKLILKKELAEEQSNKPAEHETPAKGQ